MDLNEENKGEKFQQINEILCKHFKDPYEWERIIMYARGKTLHEIVGSTLPLEFAIYKSLEKAESEGWLDRLLQKASQMRPHAEDIKKFMESVSIPVEPKKKPAQTKPLEISPTGELPRLPHRSITTYLFTRVKRIILHKKVQPAVPFRWKVISLVLVLILSTAAFLYWRESSQTDVGIKIIDGTPVGLCDGSCSFDTKRMDGHVKQEAQEAFEQGNHDKGCAYLKFAKEMDSADAEAAIYYEDQCIPNTASKYIGLIVAVPLAGGNVSDIQQGRDILQGIYVQQEEYNNNLPKTSDQKLFLFIANIVGNTQNDVEVQQAAINSISTAINDQKKNILGITGLPFVSTSISSAFANPCIPMISVSPLDESKGEVSCLHSIAPSFQAETAGILKYIQETVASTQQIAVVSPDGDLYSNQLVNAFIAENRQSTLPYSSYVSGDMGSLENTAQEMANSRPALIYFTGSADDVNIFLHDLHSLRAYIPVVGSNICYQYVHITAVQKSDFEQFAFTSFAYPDQWGIQNHQLLNNLAFTNEYDKAFNPDRSHSGNPYSYSRADSDSILGYDELSFMTDAIKELLKTPELQLSRATIEHKIEGYYPSNSKDLQFTGISGQISYERDSSIPYDKAVLMLKIWNGNIHSLNNKGQVQYGDY